jgi:hypothetical protein
MTQRRAFALLKVPVEHVQKTPNVTSATQSIRTSGAMVFAWRYPSWGLYHMREKPQQAAVGVCARKNPSERLHVLRDLTARKTKIQDITEALISSGYTSLDNQAKALGLRRSTAWTIIRNRHKLGRLSTKTIERIIANPETPPLVLAAIQRYAVDM